MVEAQGHSGGLVLLWKNEGGCTVINSSTHYIDFEVENAQVGRWRYTGFYGCPERGRRRESWNMIRYLAAQSNLPWCVIGDFNDLILSDEKKGGKEHPGYLLQGFTEVVADCGLKDLGFGGHKFTWERSRGTSTWVQERLDRGLANQAWCSLFPSAEVKVLEVATSDHLPLYLQLNRQVYVQKEKRFRFENQWLREKDCLRIVQNSWEEAVGFGIVEKIKICGVKLQEWAGGLYNEYKMQSVAYRKQLRKLRSRRDRQGIQLYNDIRWKYLNLLEKQEIFWKQRAKTFWLREGDQNTRFFHQFASTRKRNNVLHRIKDNTGAWQETNAGIRDVIVDYFSQLFIATVREGKLTEREKVQQVEESDNEDLIRGITAAEVKEATFSMHPDKSPGPDGLNPGFFQSFWHVVGTDVIRFCQEFMLTGVMPDGVNQTLVALIPKIKKPQTISDLRPISLCNVLVRILSKVLANRLKSCLKLVISDKQSAFIEGRMLSDNALVAYEVNHFMRRRTQGHMGIA